MRTRSLAAAATATAGVWCGPGLAVHSEAVARLIGVPRRLCGDRGVVLTFDDGPHPEGTPAVIEALRRAGASATFFVVGEQVQRYPSIVGELVAAGHEIALHAHVHRNQMRLPPATFARDLRQAIEVIGEAAGRPPELYRPPYGVFTPTGLKAVRAAGLRPLLWSQWGRDWRGSISPARIAKLATRNLRAGDVVLLHDSDAYSAPGCHRRTAQALPMILDEVARLRSAAAPQPQSARA